MTTTNYGKVRVNLITIPRLAMKTFRYQGRVRGLETLVSFLCGPRNATGMRIRQAAVLLCICKASFRGRHGQRGTL